MNAAVRFLLEVIVRHLRKIVARQVSTYWHLRAIVWAAWRLLLELLRLALRPSVLNPVLWAIALGVTAYAASLWLLVLQ